MKKIVASLVVIAISLLITSTLSKPKSRVAGVSTQSPNYQGIIVPHHQLASSLINQSLSKLHQSGSVYSQIVLLSPNHSGPLDQFVTTADNLDNINIDTQAVESISQLSFTTNDPEFIKTEHGILVPALIITNSFPDTPILPLAISPYHTPEDLDTLVDYLNSLPANPLFVLSSDFSHNSMVAEAASHHQTMFNIFHTFDYQKLIEVDDSYLDAPVPAAIFLKLMQKKGATTWELWDQGHSSTLLGKPEIQGTSYVTGGFFNPSPQ